MTQKLPPGSILDSNQDQERPPTSDSNQHVQEESIPNDTIDLSVAAASYDNSGGISY
jgi:hypothetical protein